MRGGGSPHPDGVRRVRNRQNARRRVRSGDIVRDIECAALVVATGGLSIPKMGATPFGYEVARQFGLASWSAAPRWCR